MDNLKYPCLIFYIEKNSNYGKSVSISDIRSPTEECYNACLGNWMTLGRDIPTFEEFCSRCVQIEYEDSLRDSKCQYTIYKLAVNSFDEINNFYNNNKENLLRFIDPKLNEHFNIIV